MKIYNKPGQANDFFNSKDKFILWFMGEVQTTCKNYYFDCVYDLHIIIEKMHELNFDRNIEYKNKRAVFYWGLNDNGTLINDDEKEYLILASIKGTHKNYKFSFDFTETTNFVKVERL